MSDRIRDTMLKVKPYCSDSDRRVVQETILLCVKAYESNKPTKKDIWSFLNRIEMCRRPFERKDFYDMADEFGLIRKEKVKRWKWTNGVVTTNETYTENELYDNTDGNWKKVEGSEVEE